MFDKILMKNLIKKQRRLLRNIKHLFYQVDRCHRRIAKTDKIDFSKTLRG